MARCGCSSTCACVIQSSAGITVSGTGTVQDPYVIAPSVNAKTIARVDQVPGTANLVIVFSDGTESAPITLPTTNTATVADGTIATAKLADGSVTEVKIGTGAVTSNKLGTASVTRAKMGTTSIFVDRGPWVAGGTAYSLYDRVDQGGRRWEARIAHNSPATFDASSWIPLSPPPAVLAYGSITLERSTSQTIPNGTPTSISFNGTPRGTAMAWSSSRPERLIAKSAGMHKVTVTLQWAANGNGSRIIAVWKQTAAEAAVGAAGSNVFDTYQGSAIAAASGGDTVANAALPGIELDVGDHLALVVTHTAGTNLGFNNTSNHGIRMTVEYLGPVA